MLQKLLDVPEAIETYREALQEDPASPDALAALMELTLHEEREGAYSRGSSVTLECDADSESLPFHSLNYVRQHVRKVNHALHVDRSPPKLDRETSEALEELNDKVAAGEITREEAATLQKKLMKTWKMSPKTSPRERLNLSQQFDLSPRHL